MTSGDRFRGVLEALQLLFPPGRVFEIRVLGDDGTSSGYFTDHTAAANELLIRDNDPRVSGIYVTLNEVNPVLLARRANRIKFRLGKKDATTADADIIRRRWLPIDIDPIRPSGVSSSDAEHTRALILAETIEASLSDLGWPRPIIADSGNGAHLLYPIDLPNDEESRTLIRSVLEFLDTRFSTPECTVDTGNFNASRIWKVYGTVSRKGDPLPDRPHRRSRIISAPDHGDLITIGQMTDLCSLYPTQKDQTLHHDSKGAGGHIDLASWLSAHHLSSTAKPYQGGTLFVLDTCPFSDAHTDGAFAIQFPNGAIFAGCHHNSCGSGRQRWPELRAKCEPDIGMRLARLRSSRIREKKKAEDGDSISQEGQETDCNITVSDSIDDALITRSREILSQGDPLSFLLETFGRSHEGDQTVAECLIHSLASRSVINSKGLHVSITGESGKGKSHAIDTMRTLIPEEFRLEGRVSDKALFSMKNTHYYHLCSQFYNPGSGALST